ncbi:unnamed protein product [Toxocara canis]|uniref:DUF968 domain-containing protein n=1 Tax=Toxocara canis TaxID=6265 RepID=A0A183UNI5_TOXCA|nr:unnamed protein product [Toxocara canis]
MALAVADTLSQCKKVAHFAKPVSRPMVLAWLLQQETVNESSQHRHTIHESWDPQVGILHLSIAHALDASQAFWETQSEILIEDS